MVRYSVTLDRLREMIVEESPTWFTRAAERTAAFVEAGRYNESSSIWSEIKPVYMKLQHNKCAYCERALGGARFSLIEHDVEHFRPKNAVVAWPTAQIMQERNINYDFATGDAFPLGYFRLAYNELNYVTACKTCNTPLKSNYFPIAGQRNPDDLEIEKPFLIYPLDNVDVDPEQLITFAGILPIPVHVAGYPNQRAQVTIDFFELDSREELLRQRAEKIRAIWIALILLDSSVDEQKKAAAKRAIKQCRAGSSPHSNCARAFYRLYQADPQRAEEIANLAMDYLDSQS